MYLMTSASATKMIINKTVSVIHITPRSVGSANRLNFPVAQANNGSVHGCFAVIVTLYSKSIQKSILF